MQRAFFLASLSVCAVLLTLQAQQPQTVRQGVYAENQARRGQAVYKAQCASCHGEMLEGRLGPPLTGEDFISDFAKQPLSELFGKIRNTMPQDNPGKLTPQEAADILAYILQAGKFPAGRAELSADEAALMLTPGRRCENGKPVPVNDPEWSKFTEELAEAGRAAYKASQTRNQETVSDVSGVIADACLHCHQVYRDRQGRGRDPIDPSNKATRCVKQ